jgi:hypothetical protein
MRGATVVADAQMGRQHVAPSGGMQALEAVRTANLILTDRGGPPPRRVNPGARPQWLIQWREDWSTLLRGGSLAVRS